MGLSCVLEPELHVQYFECKNDVKSIFGQQKNLVQEIQPCDFLKPQPNALDVSLYIARLMSSIVECCREGVAKRSRLFTRLGTQHSTDVLFDE